MSLTKPILLTTVAFDATNEHTFIFNAIGGSQVVKNKLVIRNNETNDIVYSEEQETFRFEHKVEADKLTNGTYYNAVITTFDDQGNESVPSTPIQFWCYSTPVISFTNLPLGNIIGNSSFNFEFSYNQAEDEKLNFYKMNLYNSFNNLISTSNTIYVQDGSPIYSGSYLFTGFENAKVYYIELVAITVEGTEATTGLIELTVSYIQPEAFAVVDLINNCDEGYISIKSNVTLIEGKSNPSPPVYIEDKEVDLTAPDSWVKFDEGFQISGDFMARLWFRKPTPYKEILNFSNAKGQNISIRFMNGYVNDDDTTDLKAYIEMYVYSLQGFEYYIYSDYLDILQDTEYYVLGITRKNNIYKLNFVKKE